MKIHEIIIEDADAGSTMAGNVATVTAPMNTDTPPKKKKKKSVGYNKMIRRIYPSE
jgi:hypothetical protein